jgi:hypothetical protein
LFGLGRKRQFEVVVAVVVVVVDVLLLPQN